MRALLGNRSYRRLLIGQTLSAFGDNAMYLALAIWVKTLTGSNAKAGLAILRSCCPACSDRRWASTSIGSRGAGS